MKYFTFLITLLSSFSLAREPKLVFQENKGQVNDQNNKLRPDVLFSASDGQIVFHLKKNSISYQLYKTGSRDSLYPSLTKRPANLKTSTLTTIYRLDLRWINSNPDPTIEKDEQLSGYENFFSDNFPNGITYVRSYEEILYKNIYEGIDMRYYCADGHLEYDYLVKAGADYRKIQLKIDGASSLRVNSNGELLIKTPLGEIIKPAPVVIQEGKRIKAQWHLLNNVLSFKIHSINPKKNFVIDPAVRLWGTYYGGTNGASTCAVDGAGNVFIGGSAYSSSTLVATSGAHQTTFSGAPDGFLAKLNPNGIRQWATYYGGSNIDYISGCCTDASGNIYASGSTQSLGGSVIATPGSYQYNNFVLSGQYAFLVKFDSSGIRLWGTYYGAGSESGNSCAVDSIGNVYLAGSTGSISNTIIASPGCHQSTPATSGSAFLAKFNSAGTRLWGTYYGEGSGYSCATDISGNVFLCGVTSYTTAGNYISTPGSHQPVNSGGGDAFLVKFNSAGVRQWGTFYGGIASEVALACATDSSGNIFVVGNTSTPTSTRVASPGAHQSAYGGSDDAFIVKFTKNGARAWGTYYGGSGVEEGNSCATDAYGNFYIVGGTSTSSGTSIATPGSFQSVYGTGSQDAYFAKFDSLGVRQRGTYYGGNPSDEAFGCCTGKSNIVYFAGQTSTSSFGTIATTGTHQSSLIGVANSFLVKFSDCNAPLSPIDTSPTLLACPGFTTSLSASASGTVSWYNAAIGGTLLVIGNGFNTPTLSAGTYTYFAQNTNTCSSAPARTAVIVTVSPSPTVSLNSGTICAGQTFTLIASGAASYTFSGGTSVVNPTASTIYSVTGSNSIGCMSANTATTMISVNPLPSVTATGPSTICGSSFGCLSASAAMTYTWIGPCGFTSNVQNPCLVFNSFCPCTFSLTIADFNGCQNSTTVCANVIPQPTVSITSSDTLLCLGNSATLTANGASTYSWSTGNSGISEIISPTITLNYTVTGTDANGCMNTSVITQSVASCTGFSQLSFSNSQLSIYPNPNNGNFTILMNDLQKETHFEIYNSLGQEVIRKPLKIKETQIDIGNLANGIYFVKIFEEGEMIYYSKIIKQ
jgi:hypothetical protein